MVPPTLRPLKLGPLCSPTRKEAAAPGKHPATESSRRRSCAVVLVPEMTESRAHGPPRPQGGRASSSLPTAGQAEPCGPQGPRKPTASQGLQPCPLPPCLPESLSVLPWGEGHPGTLKQEEESQRQAFHPPLLPVSSSSWPQGASSEDFDSKRTEALGPPSPLTLKPEFWSCARQRLCYNRVA